MVTLVRRKIGCGDSCGGGYVNAWGWGFGAGNGEDYGDGTGHGCGFADGDGRRGDRVVRWIWLWQKRNRRWWAVFLVGSVRSCTHSHILCLVI
jgi:hypothetical protein